MKAFTNYVCPVGYGSYGHSSHYTGASTYERDGACACGALLVDEETTKDGNLYTLTFEICDPHLAAMMESRHGRAVWASLNAEEWAALEWMPVKKESDKPLQIKAQHENLLKWAESHAQPIRNVVLVARKP